MSKYQALIDALEAGPTEGPWSVIEHSWSDTSIVAPGFDHGICCLDINHATEESQEADSALMSANATYIAAANPATIRALLADRNLGMEIIEGVLKGDRDADGRIVLHGWQVAAIEAALAQMAGG